MAKDVDEIPLDPKPVEGLGDIADKAAGDLKEERLAEDRAKAIESGEVSIMEVLLRIEAKLDAFFEGVNSGKN